MDFERPIDDLHGRIHRGADRAEPSQRTNIPRAEGKLRPLGIAALEDKIVQQAARTVLECIEEQDFPAFSYGFSVVPGRFTRLRQFRDALQDRRFRTPRRRSQRGRHLA